MALTPYGSPAYYNRTQQVIQTNVGFKISKPGFDANKTAGSNLVFSSSWPSLPIAFETTIVNPASSTLAHNLKFPPFTFLFVTKADPSGVGTTSVRSIGQVDSVNLYNLPTGTFTLNIKCFQLDISKDTDYNLAPGDVNQSPYDSNFGVKVAKPQKDINSKDMRDFSVHSRCQSPLILAVKTEATITAGNLATGIGNVIQYANAGSKPVWVYGFIKQSTGRYKPVPYYAQAYPRTFTDGYTSYIGYSGTDIGATLVILRDPMFAPTSTTVQY